MTTLLMLFLLSTGLALLLTPAVRAIGNRYGWVDKPSARAVHVGPIPRIGGVAICLSFFLPFLGGFAYPTQLTTALVTSSRAHWIVVGAALVFLIGLIDDVHRLRPGVKLAVQIVAALLAYRGGIEFAILQLPWGATWSFGWLALPATILWFLLVINAINLIDGLDGLAAGITLFASFVLLGLCLMDGRYRVAMGFAALAGSCLGFLRYNFNPASIFMGDSGSYFLGYMLAALSMLGSMKSQATVAILIPMVALGVPLMDTILTPIRRFVVGEALFKADKSHIHHRLMKLGLSHRMAVLALYGITIVFGGLTMLIVHLHDQRAGLILLILSVLVILGVRQIGYMQYWSTEKFFSYLRDVIDVIGFTNESRTFLNFQIAISRAQNLKQLWECICNALKFLTFDYAVLRLTASSLNSPSVTQEKDGPLTYSSNDQTHASSWDHKTLCIDIPLVSEDKSFGTLHLGKVIMHNPIDHHTFRRIEHLRRSVVRRLAELEEEMRSTPNADAR